MQRAPALLLLAALFAPACVSGGGLDPALVEAGRQRRRVQPPPTASELRREVDSFVENELPLLSRKAGKALEKETKLWRFTLVAGSALGVLAASSGSIASSEGETKPVLVGAGAAAAVAGGVVGALRTPRLRACVAFLDAARADTASWRSEAIPPGEGVVAEPLWHAWVDRVAAIRSHESCRGLR